jgi:hypothetical protein
MPHDFSRLDISNAGGELNQLVTVGRPSYVPYENGE